MHGHKEGDRSLDNQGKVLLSSSRSRAEGNCQGLEFITKNGVDLTIEVNKRKQEAMKEKMKGNAAYKKQDFCSAIHHYEIALELDTNDMVYWSNLAAIMFQIEAFKEVNMVT